MYVLELIIWPVAFDIEKKLTNTLIECYAYPHDKTYILTYITISLSLSLKYTAPMNTDTCIYMYFTGLEIIILSKTYFINSS